ncbi:tRNA lysidine(34) synthetase TilS [Photobacterium salinisoli]|uniref:tRNA lysidine(34) synthetase TilS n=1 Tax=Photobacterium salinisoli TaxID=1616783 RepID=UPI000EA2AD68|nr:tRNA lysidine(34) synthetase TilS [Photobacterium salinisoli]
MLFTHFSDTLLRLCPQPSQLVLALSGGLDSRVLLHLLGRFIQKYPHYQALAVHVHHGLSPNAEHWLAKCEAWAKQDAVTLHCERVSVQSGSRISLEQAAREARYGALARYVQSQEYLLTAQHADDQLETVLLALKRGSGPAGLAAMPEVKPFANGLHIRPLLDVSRAELQAYAHEHHLDWVDDESNQDRRFDRNFLRLDIVPALTSRWPGLRQAVARSAALCGEQQSLLESLLADKLNQIIAADGSLDLSEVTDGKQGRALVRLWLQHLSLPVPSKAQLEQIWRAVCLAREDANPCVSLNGYDIRRFQSRLYAVRPRPDVTKWRQAITPDTPCALPASLGVITLIRLSDGHLRSPEPDERVWIAFDPSGLSAHPLGRAGRRKLKKLFQEYGVPSWRRRQTPLLFYGDKLAAVAGLFVVEGFEGNECELVWKCDHLH